MGLTLYVCGIVYILLYLFPLVFLPNFDSRFHCLRLVSVFLLIAGFVTFQERSNEFVIERFSIIFFPKTLIYMHVISMLFCRTVICYNDKLLLKILDVTSMSKWFSWSNFLRFFKKGSTRNKNSRSQKFEVLSSYFFLWE